jgi:cobalamin biosynthesis protein CobT
MTTSNVKFRTGAKEAPTEPFKRAVTACLRAIAKKPELEVTFAAERPGLAPGKARLPEPARKMTRRDATIVRGHADSIALKLACHDPKVHRRLMPGNPQARGVFEAVEQARVEALGSRRMAGVARNLTAMLDDHFHRGKFDEITDRADAPLSDALAMLVRERLTGLAPPARWSTSGGRFWKTRSARASIGSTALPRIRRDSATLCMTCCPHWIWVTIATPKPTKTRTRTTTGTARTTNPEPKDRPIRTRRRR